MTDKKMLTTEIEDTYPWAYNSTIIEAIENPSKT
jgi:hypothetical protein